MRCGGEPDAAVVWRARAHLLWMFVRGRDACWVLQCCRSSGGTGPEATRAEAKAVAPALPEPPLPLPAPPPSDQPRQARSLGQAGGALSRGDAGEEGAASGCSRAQGEGGHMAADSRARASEPGTALSASSTMPPCCHATMPPCCPPLSRQPGENTLNALCARVVTRGMAARRGWTPKGYLGDYVEVGAWRCRRGGRAPPAAARLRASRRA